MPGSISPVLGCPRYFSDRLAFVTEGIRSTATGNFSFYFGKLQIVNLAGSEGRKLFFESKDLNFAEG